MSPHLDLRPDTLAVRGGLMRSPFDETAEALYPTSGFVYRHEGIRGLGSSDSRPRIYRVPEQRICGCPSWFSVHLREK